MKVTVKMRIGLKMRLTCPVASSIVVKDHDPNPNYASSIVVQDHDPNPNPN